MDLREIIKWFIPCFHILLAALLAAGPAGVAAGPEGVAAGPGGVAGDALAAHTKNVVRFNETYLKVNQSDRFTKTEVVEPADQSQGRTFGRPFKKLVAGLLPVVFGLGAASGWAGLAALLALKTFGVAVAILKLLLLAGALKIGAWFGQKHSAHGHGWEPAPLPHAPPPSKEIHLHIHNGQAGHEPEHAAYSGWSRNGAPVVATANAPDQSNVINVVYEPNREGLQTISTPYGNYVKVQNAVPAPIVI